jgi:hypothetical protein
MTRHVNRWTVQLAWVALMAVIGAMFVPSVMSAGSLGMFAVAGCAVVLSASILWNAHQPTVSTAQARLAVEALETGGGRK